MTTERVERISGKLREKQSTMDNDSKKRTLTRSIF